MELALRGGGDLGIFPVAVLSLGRRFELDPTWSAKLRSGASHLPWPLSFHHRAKCCRELAALCWTGMLAAKQAQDLGRACEPAKGAPREGSRI